MGGRGARYKTVYPTRGKHVSGHTLIAMYKSGFDDDGNPQVVKWQGQEDDKSARFLAKVENDLSYNDMDRHFVDKNGNIVDDEYGFYNGEYQKFSIELGLNAKPQVMGDAEFDAMVAQNNLQLLYRGESGSKATDRFMYADYGHTGVGTFGDGYYFSTDKDDAIGYARDKSGYNGTGKVETMVLSPTARAIRYSDLQRAFSGLSTNLKSALGIAGRSSSSGYMNDGEAQLALKMGYNVVAVDYGGGTYCYAIDRSAFIVRKSVETY